jgi:RNA 2',3'-cyclic 3'-phosphodiesterase
MRLFVAIRLPKEAVGSVEKAAAALDGCLGARILPPDSWHLTLRFIGEADARKAEEIGNALAGVKFAPFQVRLSGAGAFPSKGIPRAIWIGGDTQGAGELAMRISQVLTFLNLPEEHFTVHLTVARSKGVAEIDEFLKTGDVCSFETKSFCLMKSTLTPAGAVYEVLREFPAEAQ